MTDAELVVGEIEVKGASGSAVQVSETIIVDMGPSVARSSALLHTFQLPYGQYQRLRLRIAADGNEQSDRHKVSLRIQGNVKKDGVETGFLFISPMQPSLITQLGSAYIVPPDLGGRLTQSVKLIIDKSNWFVGEGGTILNPVVDANRETIEANIAGSVFGIIPQEFDGLQAVSTGAAEIPLIATHSEGSLLATFAGIGNGEEELSGVVLETPTGRILTVWTDAIGRPTRVVSDGHIAVFGNWRPGLVDIALIRPGGNIDLFTEVPTSAAFGDRVEGARGAQERPLASTQGDGDRGRVLKAAGSLASAASCLLSLIDRDLITAAEGCLSNLVTMTASEPSFVLDEGTSETRYFFGVGLKSVGCFSRTETAVLGCIFFVVEAFKPRIANAETVLLNNHEYVALAENLLGPPTGADGWQRLSAGNQHACAITVTSQTHCWGYNGAGLAFWGTLGAQDTGEHCDGIPCSTTPNLVDFMMAFDDIAAGARHTCARTAQGDGYCWGINSFGQLGNGALSAATQGTAEPTSVVGGIRFRQVVTGAVHTCGLDIDGVAYCWGNDAVGQLGTTIVTEACQTAAGSVRCSRVPLIVDSGHIFAQLTSGGNHTCGLTENGTAYCWGHNFAGQLGTGTTSNSPAPALVTGNISFESLSAGLAHTCGLTADGAGYCWGDNLRGKIGDGTETRRLIPTAVVGGDSYVDIDAGLNHTCGIRKVDHKTLCWGLNSSGQLGNGTTASNAVPTVVAPTQGTNTDIELVTVEAGGAFTCGIDVGMRAFCWGSNFGGQLGNGSRIDALTPVLVGRPGGS